MSKNGTVSLESLAKDAGVDIDAAKLSLIALDDQFGGEVGDIPEGALEAWSHAHFDQARLRKIAILLGRCWEREHVATLPTERAWERGPDAAKIKRHMNEKKAKK